MRCAILAPLLFLLAAPGYAAPAPEGSLTGPGWSAAFRQGVLVRLQDRLTGERFVAGNAAAALTGVRRGRDGLAVTSAGEPAARVSGTPARLEASWPGGERLTQAAAVEGGELVVRQEASVPQAPLSGVQWGLGEVPAGVEVIVPGHSGLRLGADAPDGSYHFDYPVSWEAQFVLLQGKRGGFLIRTDDTAPQFKGLTVQRRDGRATLAFETQAPAPFARVTSLKSVTWHLRPYRGTWQEGARLYREWAEKAFDLPATLATRPRWVERIRCVFIVPMDTQLLDELARRVKPQETLLYVPSWRRDGYDRNYPDYTAEEKFGPWIEHAHALGFRVMPHVNYFGCDPLNPLYERFKAQQMRDPFSDAPLWWTWDRAAPPIKFAYINPASRAWRELFVQRMREFCAKYRVDALHLDQTLCMYNDNNGLIDGMNSMQGNLALHAELRAALPEVAISGEGLDEITYRWEQFAQRHPYGLDFVEGTWNNRRLAMTHPISSAILTPHTAIYGYLGMTNPSSGELYQAWRRAYDRLGVLPTLAHLSLSQIRSAPEQLEPFFAEMRFFQRTQAVADFASPWPADALFLYKLEGGGRAVLKRDRGLVLAAQMPDGRREELCRRVEGVREAGLPGSIPGWRAYDEKRLLGLDPAHSYPYSPAPRDPQAFHLAGLPEGVVVERVGAREELASVALADAGGDVARLWDFTGRAESGVRLFDGTERRYPGALFEDPSGGNGQPESDSIFLHPPWRATGHDEKAGVDLAKGIGVSFIEYRLRLPDRPRIRFETGVGLRAGAVGKSDGVTFRVEARHGSLKREAKVHHAGAEPVPLLLDLSPFHGQEILLRLETDPGPAGQATFDWARFTRPRVTAEDPTAREVLFHSPKPILAALGPTGELPLQAPGTGRYAVRVPVPGAFFLLFAAPRTPALPLDLVTAPRSAALVLYDGRESPPADFMQPQPGEAVVAGQSRPALGAHPPSNGQMVLDYALRLPSGPARLEAYAGIRDGSTSSGVGFSVRVNGREVWSARMLPKEPWKRVEVDLAPWAGKRVVLSLITDSLGPYDFDWAAWGEPRVVSGSAVGR